MWFHKAKLEFQKRLWRTLKHHLDREAKGKGVYPITCSYRLEHSHVCMSVQCSRLLSVSYSFQNQASFFKQEYIVVGKHPNLLQNKLIIAISEGVRFYVCLWNSPFKKKKSIAERNGMDYNFPAPTYCNIWIYKNEFSIPGFRIHCREMLSYQTSEITWNYQ